MTTGDVAYGFRCPSCGLRSAVLAQVGDDAADVAPRCPVCKSGMVLDSEAEPVAVNHRCEKCNSSFGMVTSSTCPLCGEKLTPQSSC